MQVAWITHSLLDANILKIALILYTGRELKAPVLEEIFSGPFPTAPDNKLFAPSSRSAQGLTELAISEPRQGGGATVAGLSSVSGCTITTHWRNFRALGENNMRENITQTVSTTATATLDNQQEIAFG